MGGVIAVGAALGGAVLAGKAIKSIWDECSSSSYTPSASVTASHAKSNADILAELKAKVHEVTEKKEKEILDYVNRSIDELLNELDKVNGKSFGGKSLNINIKEIKNKNNALKKEVIGFLGNYMDDRLVLSNNKLAEILEEIDDKKRKKQFDSFYQKLQRQAVKELKSKVESTVHKQAEIVRNEIENRLAEVDKNMQETAKAYEEIRRMQEEQEKAGIEEKQIIYCYQYELAEILLEQLES